MKATNYIYILLFTISLLSSNSCKQQEQKQSIRVSTNSLKAAMENHITLFTLLALFLQYLTLYYLLEQWVQGKIYS